MVGTRHLAKARAFYVPLFEQMGLAVCYEDEQVVSWGNKDDDTVPRFFVCYPFDGEPASVGNGTMVAFRVHRGADVDQLHAMAIEAGATDEGSPGFRLESYGDRFYVGYLRDLDGNKLAFACYDAKANP